MINLIVLICVLLEAAQTFFAQQDTTTLREKAAEVLDKLISECLSERPGIGAV